MIIVSKEERQNIENKNIISGYCTFSDIVLSAAEALEKQILSDKPGKAVIACGSGRKGEIGRKLRELLKQNSDIDITIIDEKHSENVFRNAEYIVDCIRGYDESDSISFPYDAWIDMINESDAYVLACDLPSGIDCDNGTVCKHTVKADATVVHGFPFRGVYLFPGSSYCGKLIYAESVLKAYEFKAETVSYDYDEIIGMLPVRSSHSHKGDYGRVLLIGGSENMVGACIMCGRMILKAGAGLLTVLSYRETVRTAHEVLPEAMTMTIRENDLDSQLAEIELDNYTLIVFGPGAGRNKITEKILKYVLRSDKDVILDADGLYYLKDSIELLHRQYMTVITPHLGEYQRIFEYRPSNIIPDLISISAEYPNLITVLKSENTLTTYDRQITVNRTGNNALAKGGSGDVLCGLIAGLFARQPDINSVIAAVYIHSLAADYWIRENSAYSLLASDLILQIEKILFEMTGNVK